MADIKISLNVFKAFLMYNCIINTVDCIILYAWDNFKHICKKVHEVYTKIHIVGFF